MATPTSKNINYTSRDFNTLRQSLIEYSKTYYPTTYNDFSPSSPGTMFIEMAAYVGDILNFYLDNQFQENFVQYARQSSNLFTLAYMLGYKPKVVSPATVELTLYQQVPATTSGGVTVPDFSYAMKLDSGATIGTSTNSNITFIIEDEVDFSYSSSSSPTEVQVYQLTGTQPSRYLLTKKALAFSATAKTKTVAVNATEDFFTTNITDSNILGVQSIIDSNDNVYYEVDYLAQDMVFQSIKNTNTNDPNFYTDAQDVPYLLKLIQADRRFVTRFLNRNTLQVQFGSGTNNNEDEIITPNPDNVGLGLPFEQDKLTTAFSPTNFIFTDSYGTAPTAGSTLTIRYLVGGGVGSNVNTGFLNTLNSGNLTFQNTNLNSTLANTIFATFAVDNLEAATGGGDGDTPDTIRMNSMAQFASQLRTVTKDDYIVRSLSLPSRYGQIAKVLATPQLASQSTSTEKVTSLDLYVLSYTRAKNLSTAPTALKNNLKTYLSQYRMINDTVNIKDGFIINVGVNFDVILEPNYNSSAVISNCIVYLQSYFQIDNWEFGQPINIKEIIQGLDDVPGVQSVEKVEVVNKAGGNYSQYGYDIGAATVNNMIYPSIDPSIFEVKFPNLDFKGRVVSI